MVKPQRDEKKVRLWTSILVAIATGVVMLILISIYKSINDLDKWGQFMSSLGCGVLIAGASLSGGGFLGFLFGIPSITQDPRARIKYNDNLVQISDWLTKIIVGVGLTQLYRIPGKVLQVGEAFQANFGAGDWGRNIAISIICYFFLLGFFMMYFWTKTDYSFIIVDADQEINNKQLNKLTAQNRINAEEEEKKVAEETQTNIPTLPPVMFPEDPQKGRFGGMAERNGRKLSATVTPGPSTSYFSVCLTVESTDAAKPLNSEVIFYLHDSFNPSVYAMKPEEFTKGKAIDDSIQAWGAFTVGVITDDGNTLLELDLAELPDAPKLFRER